MCAVRISKSASGWFKKRRLSYKASKTERLLERLPPKLFKTFKGKWNIHIKILDNNLVNQIGATVSGRLQCYHNPCLFDLFFLFFYYCVVIFTHRLQSTLLAFGISGHADIPAMKNKPVVKFMNQFCRYIFHKLGFCL